MRPLVDWWQPADMPMVWRWARVEAKCQLLAEWLASKVDIADDGTVRPGDIDQDGNVRPAADLLARLEAQASGLASKLGLEPTSRARLGRDVAASRVDLARLWAAEAADEAGMDDDTSEADTAAAAGVERAEVAE